MPGVEPKFSPTQEVRFALVMYGGSSLCIYMNGVAQEFLNLVRATAPSAPLSQNPTHVRPAKSTEAVYRQLGQLLRYGLEPRPTVEDAEVTTRFVVDIISGSSAGGINGIFLARALANDAELDQLKQLWVEEGDFALLLNDKGSTGDKPRIPLRKPPESLMNSHRMYYKLLDAFTGMGERDENFESPLVEELDLAVTTTDLNGLTMPIKLYDSVVLEPRYRNVFRLKYRTTVSSGRKQNDFAYFHAGLAFVARCTSSFPFVFEPMTLDDINAVAAANGTAKVPLTGSDTSWDAVYFPEYARAGDLYRLRPFSDGGDIDNKPFSYAIDNLSVRRSTVPVVRKLIYVEPDPGQYELGADASAWVDPIKSVLLAGTLPRKETIREDLDRVRAHNVAARRVAEAVETVERALEESPARSVTGEPTTERTDAVTAEWVDQRGQQLRALGLSHRLYHRTKVQQTVSQLGRLLAEAVGHDPESDRGLAVGVLVQAWVAARYADPFLDARPGDDGDTERRFLLDFDVEYRMRRINFVERRADELLCHGNPRSRRLLELATGLAEAPGSQATYDKALKDAKRELNAAFVGLRRFRRQLGERVIAEITPLGIAPAQLDAILVAQAAQQVLHGISVDRQAAREVTFVGEPQSYPNPLDRSGFRFTALGPRDDDAIRRGALDRHDDDPSTARTVLWASRGPLGEAPLIALDAASALVIDLDGPASELTLTVSALAWPPVLYAFGADGALLDAAVSPAADRPGTGRITVRAAGIRRVVVRSRTGAIATQATPLARAEALLQDPQLAGGIRTLADDVRGAFEEALRAASAAVGVTLQHSDALDPENTARRALRFFYDQFDAYDMATLPLLLSYGGEITQVDVFRISPYDAPSLVPASKAAGKLAGNQLGHYGAFLSAAWRRSDIMWGRLDAAERLITALLPVGHPQREALVTEAQDIILREELAGEEMTRALEKAVLAGDTGAVPGAVAQVRSAVEKALKPEGLRGAIQTGYGLPDGPDARYTLDVASRATRIVGDLLKGLTDAGPRRPGLPPGAPPAGAGALSWPGRILARLGQAVWGLVEIAVPGTIRWRIARYYLQLLTFVEVFLIGAGILLGQRAAVRLGWLTLGITLFLILAKAVMKEVLRSRARLLSALLALVGLLAIVLAVFGGARVAHNAKGAACRSDNWLVERAQPFDCPGADITPSAPAPR